MNKIVVLLCIAALGFGFAGCEKKKSTDEQLKENTAKEAELIKKSVSEKADKLGNALEKGIEDLKK